MAKTPLPIDEVLPEIIEALRTESNLVLRAPPGAGKTTRVGPALLDAKLFDDSILMLEPRRVAARAAARRIAKERGARVGGEIGYRVRFEDKTSKHTRLTVLTEGLLTRRLESDPMLEGVGAVLLDEFHERSVHADLGLAFLRELQETLRPELRIVVMSATLITEPIAAFLGHAKIVDSPGRMFPVEKLYLDQPDDRRIEDVVSSALRRVRSDDDDGGDVLVFLPGGGEIRRTQDKLEDYPSRDFEIMPLYGDLTAEQQDRALEPGPRRKVVLATNIAETSLTIEGVTTVVDSGQVKRIFHDPARGMDRLDLGRISRASAEQRAGRAGRTAPGRAFRLWTRAEEMRFSDHETPEIVRVDLAPVLLDVLGWAARDPSTFAWFEAPPPAHIERALSLLRGLGAVEHDGFRLTEVGETLRRLPIHPRLGATLLRAHALGVLREGALMVALLSERDVLRRVRGPEADRHQAEGPSDLLHRMDLIAALDRGARPQSLGLDRSAVRNVQQVAQRLASWGKRLGAAGSRPSSDAEIESALQRSLLAGFVDRVAQRREPGSDRVLIASGRGARLAPESVVRRAPYLVAVLVDDSTRASARAESWVRIASAIEPEWLEKEGSGTTVRREVRFDEARELVEAVDEKIYGAIVLESHRVTDVDAQDIARALARAASPKADSLLSKEAHAWLQRLAFVQREMPDLELPDLSFEALIEDAAYGARKISDLRKTDWVAAIKARLGYATAQRIESLAPERIEVPSGSKVRLRYEAEGPPVLAVRLQEVFGLTETPRVADGRIRVKMELLAPNQRPVQVTQDMESFWERTYPEVRKDLRARYAKHSWPEDGRTAEPQRRPRRRRRK